MRILVVEDELHLAEALTQILKKNNYIVDAVNAVDARGCLNLEGFEDYQNPASDP